MTASAFKAAADRLGCEVAAIKAVASVEANGKGHLPDGRPKVLFEAHHFDRLTNGKFRAQFPNLSSKTWDRKLYSGDTLKEWDRLNAAAKLNEQAAFKSASYGTFQIMGFNHARCGYETVEAFYYAMHDTEDVHLAAFCRFIEADTRLAQAIRGKNWATFARIYNGPEFARNSYDKKMATAYGRFSR